MRIITPSSSLSSTPSCTESAETQIAPHASTEEGREVFSALTSDLEDESAGMRLAAVLALGDYGPEAVPGLCAALEDRDLEIATAAAAVLGRIGDSHAISALTQVTLGRLRGRSRLSQTALGILVSGAGVVTGLVGLCCALQILFGIRDMYAPHDPTAGVMECVLTAAALALGAAAFAGPFLYYERQRRLGRFFRAASQALAQIVERSPTPGARAVLPKLAVAAADSLHQPQSTLTALHDSMRRIDVATSALRDLPIPGRAARTSDDQNLPRHAEAPSPAEETLPRGSA